METPFETPFQLTFGVEIELIVRFDIDECEITQFDQVVRAMIESRRTRNHRAISILRAHIIRLLQEQEIPVNSLNQEGYEKWTVDTDGSIDSSLDMPRGWESFSHYGIEIKTPVYPFLDSALSDMSRVINLVTSNMHTFVNESCGLHVHVGNGQRGFRLQTLKNFCMLITSFESQINSLHPLHRILNEHATPVGRVFEGDSPQDKVNRVNGFRTVRDIEECYNCYFGRAYNYCAYNFLNLLHTSLKTIEFRQHEGAIDAGEISMWVETVCAFVQLSHDAGDDGFMDLVQEHMEDPIYTIIDLFRDLGLNRSLTYYAFRGIYAHPRQPWEFL